MACDHLTLNEPAYDYIGNSWQWELAGTIKSFGVSGRETWKSYSRIAYVTSYDGYAKVTVPEVVTARAYQFTSRLSDPASSNEVLLVLE